MARPEPTVRPGGLEHRRHRVGFTTDIDIVTVDTLEPSLGKAERVFDLRPRA